MSSKEAKTESPAKKLKEIGTEIYYEKLGDIIGKLSAWRLQKDLFISDFYSNPYHEILQQTKANHATVQSESTGLMETLYDMKQTLSKFNTETHKEKAGYNQSKKQREKESSFSKINSMWADKKENLKRLSNFVYTFYSIVNTELGEIKKDLGTLQHHQKKLKSLKNQYDGQYANKFEVNSTKKKNKYFELGKAQEALQIFNEENVSYNVLFNLMEVQSTKILRGTEKFFRNLRANLITFSVFYKNCFHDKIDEILTENAQELESSFSKQLNAFLNNFEDLRQRKAEKQTYVRKMLESIIWITLQQISITSWDILAKVEPSKQYKPKKAILTIDYKFIIAENEKELFETEIYLLDSQVQGPNENGEFTIKTKKKQKIYVKFESEARQDEFILHYQKAQGGI